MKISIIESNGLCKTVVDLDIIDYTKYDKCLEISGKNESIYQRFIEIAEITQITNIENIIKHFAYNDNFPNIVYESNISELTKIEIICTLIHAESTSNYNYNPNYNYLIKLLSSLKKCDFTMVDKMCSIFGKCYSRYSESFFALFYYLLSVDFRNKYDGSLKPIYNLINYYDDILDKRLCQFDKQSIEIMDILISLYITDADTIKQLNNYDIDRLIIDLIVRYWNKFQNIPKLTTDIEKILYSNYVNVLMLLLLIQKLMIPLKLVEKYKQIILDKIFTIWYESDYIPLRLLNYINVDENDIIKKSNVELLFIYCLLIEAKKKYVIIIQKHPDMINDFFVYLTDGIIYENNNKVFTNSIRLVNLLFNMGLKIDNVKFKILLKHNFDLLVYIVKTHQNEQINRFITNKSNEKIDILKKYICS